MPEEILAQYVDSQQPIEEDRLDGLLNWYLSDKEEPMKIKNNVMIKSFSTTVSDAQLQRFTVQALQPEFNNYPNLRDAFRAELIQGIINAEAKRFGFNDGYPSLAQPLPGYEEIPQSWARVLVSYKLPLIDPGKEGGFVITVAGAGAGTGFVIGAGAGAGIAATTGAILVKAGMIAAVTGTAILTATGIGAVIGVIVALGIIGTVAVSKDLNSTVGRGQIGKPAWDDAFNTKENGGKDLSRYFPNYLANLTDSTQLKTTMEEYFKKYNLNSMSVVLNPLDTANIKLLDNFAIGSVLLTKIIDSIKRGRSAEDTVKYGIARYHASVKALNAINTALGQYGSLSFPPRSAQEDKRLSENNLGFDGQKIISYVYEVYEQTSNSAQTITHG